MSWSVSNVNDKMKITSSKFAIAISYNNYVMWIQPAKFQRGL